MSYAYICLLHDAYENTWRCIELELYFSPSAGGLKKKSKRRVLTIVFFVFFCFLHAFFLFFDSR